MRRGRTIVWGRILTALVSGAYLACVLAVSVVGSEPARRRPEPSQIVVVGASIATGYRSAPGVDWPALVGARLRSGSSATAVVNRSVSATRLLVSAPRRPSYLDREPAALARPHIGVVVLTDLINDIQALPHQYDPAVLLAGVRRFTDVAHAHGVLVVATTITPYGGYAYSSLQRFSMAGERCRDAVNRALRAGGVVDRVIDFDRVLADPHDSTRVSPGFDSGDHLHPDAAGQRAMAAAGFAVLRQVEHTLVRGTR